MAMIIIAALSASAAGEAVVRDIPDTASAGDTITVRLTQQGFLLNVVEVTEILPEGFEYMVDSYTGSDPPTYHTNNNTLVMYLAGEDTVTYTVTAGTFEQIGNARFTGTYYGLVGTDEKSGSVTGDDTLTPVVEQPTPTPTDHRPSGDGGISAPTATAPEANITPTSVETETPVETPTINETPTVTETPTATAPPAAKTPKRTPGFEGAYTIAGLIALVLIIRRYRNE